MNSITLRKTMQEYFLLAQKRETDSIVEAVRELVAETKTAARKIIIEPEFMAIELWKLNRGVLYEFFEDLEIDFQCRTHTLHIDLNTLRIHHFIGCAACDYDDDFIFLCQRRGFIGDGSDIDTQHCFDQFADIVAQHTEKIRDAARAIAM